MLVRAALAVLLLAPSATAQVRGGVTSPVVFEGLAVDAETGEPLPGATAQLPGRMGGTAADREGRFQISLPSLPDTVVVRFLGYAAAQVVVTSAPTGRRTVRLAPAPYLLGEVVVSAEPPGERLWRRVLRRKAELAPRVDAWQGEGYSRLLLERRGSLERQKRPVRLTETVSNVAWRTGVGVREDVVARLRVPEGRPYRYVDLAAVVDPMWEDWIEVGGRTVPGPTHPDAFEYYAFRLGETVETGGRRYLDLAVIPKRGDLPRGRVRVVDSLFVLAEADLRLDPFRRSGMVPHFEEAVRVRYAPAPGRPALGDSVWVPFALDRSGQVDVETAGVRLPTVFFTQTTRIANRGLGSHRLVADWTDPRRYRSPARLYGAPYLFSFGRDYAPLTDVERRADRELGPYSLSDLLFKEGILRRYVPIPIYGDDG